MAVTYPLGLPIPLVNSYSNIDMVKYVRNNPSQGKLTYALLAEDKPVFFKVSWFFTDLEFQVFEGFFKHELTSGSKLFDLNLKVGGGLRSHEVYFNKNYSSKLAGKQWRVSGNLIGLSKEYDSQATFEGLENIGIIANYATQALAIATPSQSSLSLDTNSSKINVDANSWTAIELDTADIATFNDQIDLVEGINMTFELWEKVASVDSVITSLSGQTAPASIATGTPNGSATNLYFLLKNVSTVNRFIKILVPS